MTLSSGIIKKIFELRDADQSVRAISTELGIGITTVQRYLKKGKEAVLSRKSRSRRKKKTIGRREAVETDMRKTKGFDEDILTGSQMLDLIISEVTQSRERPAIVRMVENHLTDSDYGMSKLSEALNLSNIEANNKRFILRNWGDYAGVTSIDKYIGVKKKGDSKKAITDFFEQWHDDEIQYLEKIKKRKELKDLRKQVRESEETQAKIPIIIDGAMSYVTPQVASDWQQYKTKQEQDRKPEETQDKIPFVTADGTFIYVTPQERSDWQQYEAQQKQKGREQEKRRESYKYKSEEREEREESEHIEEIDKDYRQNENEKKAE